MNEFLTFLESIDDNTKKEKMEMLLCWVSDNFTYLIPIIAWKQPMFLEHGTFIIGFSYSKKHISIAIEADFFEKFKNSILASDYKCSKVLFFIEWDAIINYSLLNEIIQYIITTKKTCNSFWTKKI